MAKALVAEEHIKNKLKVIFTQCDHNTNYVNFTYQDILVQILCTFDAWTSGAYNPYLAVMAHYISSPPVQPNNWELHLRILGFTKIKGNDSWANTAAVILQVIDCYGIQDKVS